MFGDVMHQFADNLKEQNTKIAVKLLDAEAKIGVKLTESYAMWPGSSVSGFYYAHPESRYFGVGKIERDQVQDYALRKNWTLEEAERWLAPLLNYNPRAVDAA